jgi:hypothetical protein
LADHTGNNQHIHRQSSGVRDTDLRAYGFDGTELALLALCRRLFEAVSNGRPASWTAARAAATEFYGCGLAEPVLNATLEAVDAMRRLRSTAFNYRKDGCSCCRNRITPEERLFISAFHNLRRGKRSRAYVKSMLLVEGQEPAALLVALEMLDYTLYELGLT